MNHAHPSFSGLLRIGACLSAALLLAAFAAFDSTRAVAAPPAAGTLLPLAGASVGQSGFGTIKGRLVWNGAMPAPKALSTDKDPEVCGKPPIFDRGFAVDAKTKGIKHGIAYLVAPKGKNPDAEKALLAKAANVEIDQKNCEFIPYTLAMHKDQTLVFKSSDPVNHNIRYTGFANGGFNQMLGPNASLERKLVAEKRVMPLACDIHPWMKGFVMVLDHPFFAITGEDGSFEIQGVPAGVQNVVVWQDKVGYVTAGLGRGTAVTVPAGGSVDIGEVKLDPAKVK
jgi:plastocyanin